MMTSSRPRNEIPGGFSSRRGHASQLSISDPSHHVTEAIGTLYGDEDDSGSEGGRPLSFVGGSSYSEQLQRSSLLPEPHEQDDFRQASRRRSVPHPSPDSPTSPAEHGSLNKTHTLHTPSFSQRTGGPHKHGAKSSASPTLSLRDMQADSTGSQFPLTNIDNPSDIAQELSNLQALRRLSMDVGNYIDPDMPHTTLVAMPAVAPRGDDDENDPSRLLWVPARVHPELAPTEFKSFLEKRVQSIRRRSGDSFLAVDGDPSSGLLSLRRNKSTLSRQIDNTVAPGKGLRSTVTKQHSQPQYSPKSPNTMQMQTANDTLASPSSLSGGDASRTDNLTFIPTLTQPEQKPDKRSKKDRDDDSASTSSRSGSAWKWFKGVTDDREKKKDESRKSKTRAAAEKSQDNVRLDVIQTSIDKNHVKGRESLVLDRENADSKLTEERKRESNRKSDSKKDKDGSIFSSIFGGSKRKEDKEKVNKKNQHLQVPEDIPYKPLTPDVDYNWTRFPLLEERAIYRMAHIKLANPRRSLLSQVLLSNFMYSYLAIVQAMHPQMNVPTSPQQKRLEEEARRRRQEQEYLARQQMQGDQDADNSLDHYNLDYHRATVQYAESDGQVDYVDDARIYEDAHGDERHEDYGYEGIEGYSRDTKDQQHTRDSGDDHRRHGQDDMW
ncbi:hypothetical protein G6O67_006039 [Ophiocordyceps sinensis]|uniref:Protein Zds1 C-terminal domain-containing protein n=1 Tax=Ophiocordyceps sinensis TaxID=72228 RepID=A0A8H4PPD0_9HYPO|nr:hypothetical protein G6O67_006039 [Ophiocordyceps sinensis]